MNLMQKTKLAVFVALLAGASACSQDNVVDTPNDTRQAADTAQLETEAVVVTRTVETTELEQDNQQASNARTGEKEHTVYFEFDSAELTSDAKDKLSKLVEEMEGKDEPVSVTVAGHTDQVGSEPYNEELAERRAEAVKEYLKQSELEVSNVEVRAVGEERPVYGEPAENRRVNIEPDGESEGISATNGAE